MVTNPKQVKLKSLLDAFPNVEPLTRLPGTSHLMVFTNLDLGSHRLGETTTMVVGPGRTYKTMAEIKDKPIGDLPSNFKYATHFVDLAAPELGEVYE